MMLSPRGPASTPGNARSLVLMGAVLFIAFISVTALRKVMSGLPPGQIAEHMAPWAVLWLLAILVFVPGLLLAERAAISWGRVGPYLVVVLVGSALVGLLFIPLLDWVGLPALAWRRSHGTWVPCQVFVSLDVLVRVGLAAFMYARHRERLEAAQAIQTLEARQTQTMGRIAASRLEAARARVQPEAFIAEVRTLRGTFVADPAAGSAALETLILRLRAASRSAAS
jgi:cation transport ATPase